MRREVTAHRGSAPGMRRGDILVEFALVAIIGYFFFAGVITYARLFFGGQVIQNAVDIMARETSRQPLPGNITFEELLTDDPNDASTPQSVKDFQQQIYSEQWLVADITGWVNNTDPCAGGSVGDYLACKGMPIVNQALLPLMYQKVDGNSTYLVYPGALADTPLGQTVIIPIVTSRSASGTETISWSRVIEEVEAPGSPDPFQLTSPEGGMVQVRVNYPYQSATMVSFQQQNATSTSPDVYHSNRGFAFATRNQANDAGVTAGALPVGITGLSGSTDAENEDPYQTYGGKYGLGAQGAFVETVRPFRRVLSAQSFQRREVFE